MVQANEHFSPAHQLLLAQFREPRAVTPGGYLSGRTTDEWLAALSEPISAAISGFVSKGLLLQASTDETLALVLKVPELKEKLRQLGQPVSGKKADLATRLAESAPSLAVSLAKDLNVFKTTDQGNQLVADFLAASQTNRMIMEEALIDLITRGQFRNAVTTMASFEASQVFPRGMNVDWTHYDPKPDERILQLIFSRLPRAAAEVPAQFLPTCRVGAAMLHLIWNVGQVTSWLSSHIPGENKDRLFKIASDLCSHALFLNEIDSLKRLGIHRVTLRTCNDQLVCASCRALAEKSYDIKDPPQIPNPNCSSTVCRCWISGDWSQ
jgi:hypothetical protein